MKNSLKFLLKMTVASILVLWLVLHVDWPVIGKEIREASFPLLFLALSWYVASILISVSRWQVTARFKGFALTFREAWNYNISGLFLNNFLPSFLGGDAFRSYLLGKKERRYAAAASTVLFVRFTGLWATIVLFLFFGLIAYHDILGKPLFGSIGLLLSVILVADVSLTIFSDHSLVQRFFQLFPVKLKSFFAEISGYTDREFVWRSFLVSILFTFLGVGLFNATIFWALGEQIALRPFFSVIFLISIVSSLPVSIGNIGIKEWAYFTFFPAIGINPEAALTVALLGRFIQMLVSLFGASSVLREKRELKMAKKSSLNAAQAEAEEL